MSLDSVFVEWDEPLEISSSVFTNGVVTPATLFVPIGTREKYSTAEVWKLFSNTQEYEVSKYDLNGQEIR